MIDDNKIEEAANLHRFELIVSMHGSTLGTPMQCFEEVIDAKTDLIENSFITGAKWAINELLKDLWHPASEMPDKNRICLVRVVYHLNCGMLPDEERIEQSSFHDFGWYDYDFKYIGTNYDIISWLYVDDLLPKEG